MTKTTKGPACGHSICSQNYIDTGKAHCVFAKDVKAILDLRLDDRDAKLRAAEAYLIARGLGVTTRAEIFLDAGVKPEESDVAWAVTGARP